MMLNNIYDIEKLVFHSTIFKLLQGPAHSETHQSFSIITKLVQATRKHQKS